MKDTETIDSFVGKLLELSTKSAALGERIEEPKLVKKFLNSLPKKKYIHIKAALEQVLDLNKTSFEDIVRRLKAYEERIYDEEEDKGNDQSKLVYANADLQAYQRSESGRGRGYGGQFFNRGRGRGRYGGYKQERDKLTIVCFWCAKTEQYVSVCQDRLLKLQEAHEN